MIIKHLKFYKDFIGGLKKVDINVAKPYDLVPNFKTNDKRSYKNASPKVKYITRRKMLGE